MKDLPKHIAIVVNYFPTISQTFIVNQINSLIAAGIEVKLYAYQEVNLPVIHASIKAHDLLHTVTYFVKPPTSKFVRIGTFLKWTYKHFNNIKWPLYFKTLNVLKYGKDAYTLKLFFEAQWFLVPNTTSLIHAHFGMVGNRIAYLKAKGILPNEIPLITTFHGYDLVPNELKTYKKSYAYLLEKANTFTVNTPYLEGILQQLIGNEKNCNILPVGLDTTFFKKNKETKDASVFKLVFCGKLFPLKGPDLAITIVKKLHDLGYTQVVLHVIGDGVLFSDLKQQIEEKQLQDAVFLHGKQTQESIKEIYAQSDVFILPGRVEDKTGRAETQGLVIQEAQAMELPVVVSDAGGMKYGLLPNKSGFVITEGDVNGFVVAIEKLIHDPHLKEKMGKAGRDFIEKNYDNHVLLVKLLAIYRGSM